MVAIKKFWSSGLVAMIRNIIEFLRFPERILALLNHSDGHNSSKINIDFQQQSTY